MISSMPEWMVADRNDLRRYSDYGDNADQIGSIGQVFPVIFSWWLHNEIWLPRHEWWKNREQIGTMRLTKDASMQYIKYLCICLSCLQ